MDRVSALKQIDEALTVGRNIPDEYQRGMESAGSYATTLLFTTIERFISASSQYEKSLIDLREKDKKFYPGYMTSRLVGVLLALRQDIENGYLQSLSGLIRADEFSDFLSMAQHFLDEGYKDPAAVIAGSVLEQHLRALGKLHNIDVTLPDGRWKKADAMNSDLVKADVYSKLTAKNVTSWLGLRNEAAHGNYNGYELANVRLMIDGLSLFIGQNRA